MRTDCNADRRARQRSVEMEEQFAIVTSTIAESVIAGALFPPRRTATPEGSLRTSASGPFRSGRASAMDLEAKPDQSGRIRFHPWPNRGFICPP